MRKFVLVTCLALAAAIAVPSVASAEPFSGSFDNTIRKKDVAPCGAALTCGTGTIAGYGAASFVLVPTGVPVPADGCLEIPAQVILTLADGGGTLTLSGTGLACTPGRSGEAPGQERSFGNPLRATGTFSVTGGTGVFAGATGTISGTLRLAGAHVSLQISGDVSTS